MTIDPLSDILGIGDPPKPDPAAALAKHVSMKAAASGRAFEDVGGPSAFRRPVTISFLTKVFEMDVQTITRRLIDCPYVEQRGGAVGAPRKLYEFKEAVSYIIKPKMTPEQFVKTLNSAHMPAEINKVFWDGQRSRVKYKIEAQEAWETHEVNAAMGDLCMTMKEGLSTITEAMRERAKLSDEQCDLLDAGIEDLRNRLMEKLEELAERTATPSMFGKPLFGAPGVKTAGIDDDDMSWREVEGE